MREPRRTDERPTSMIRSGLHARPSAGGIVAALIVAAALIAVSGCGDDRADGSHTPPDSTTHATSGATPGATTPAPAIVMRYATEGGCEVAGHNCPTYTLWSDGTVEIRRTGIDGAAEITGHIDTAEVATWSASVATLDVTALGAQVGPGVCNSCVDGADIVVTIERPAGTVVLDSTKLEFDPANEFFARLERLMTDVRAVGALPMVFSS